MKRLIILCSALMLSACSSVDFQTTSGAAYIAESPINDPDLRRAAAYEPNLHFPARIGVVRLVYGKITSTPSRERAAFAQALARVPAEIVQLGALESRMSNGHQRHPSADYIRNLAASRHLDYVLIISYDPGQNTAEALFLDTRTGYPYASVEVAPPGRGRHNFWGGHLRSDARIRTATLRLARALAPDIDAMVTGLLARAG